MSVEMLALIAVMALCIIALAVIMFNGSKPQPQRVKTARNKAGGVDFDYTPRLKDGMK